MTKSLTKNKKIKRIKSNIEDFSDIVWKNTEGKNLIIDDAIVNDDLTLTIEFQNKKYTVRSPDRRITKKIRDFQRREELTIDETIEADNLQEKMIEDMVDGLSIENHPQRISEKEYDDLAIMCWHYFEFSKKKSISQASDSIL